MGFWFLSAFLVSASVVRIIDENTDFAEFSDQFGREQVTDVVWVCQQLRGSQFPRLNMGVEDVFSC